MKIDILCTDGSPIGICPDCLWGDEYRIGVGGSEYALLTMCDAWSKAGHQVCLYNTPHKYSNNVFEQRPVDAFNPRDNRDVIITFRTPNPKAVVANGMKVWWSCDQYTSVDFRPFAPTMDKIVCISPYHKEHFAHVYSILNAIYIDLAIRLDDFGTPEPIQNRLIFTSVPNRGLHHLHRMYRKIYDVIPDTSLVITSDYRLWGADALNERHRVGWALEPNVKFLGALRRQQYINELLKADMIVYPCEYDELFCIAIAEAECCGVYPITTGYGALPTTNMGSVFHIDVRDDRNDRLFIDRILELLHNRDELNQKKSDIMLKSRERFSLENILTQWNKEVFEI